VIDDALDVGAWGGRAGTLFGRRRGSFRTILGRRLASPWNLKTRRSWRRPRSAIVEFQAGCTPMKLDYEGRSKLRTAARKRLESSGADPHGGQAVTKPYSQELRRGTIARLKSAPG